MGLSVNPDLLTEDGSKPDDAKLPDGVYREVVWDDDEHPDRSDDTDERVELFRVNGRVYTLPKVVNPRIAFKLLRDMRKRRSSPELVMADMIGEVLGDPILDVLAEEDLEPEELASVMKAVAKHTMGSLQKVLGN